MRNRFLSALALFVCVVLVASSPARAACTAGNPNANIAESTPSSAFVDQGNGTVTHQLTGLMWKQCAEGLSGAGCSSGRLSTMNWPAALGAAASANANNFGGFSGWRLPNKKELESIVEVCGFSPAINQTIFPGTSTSVPFWSASPSTANPAFAWGVTFIDGGSAALTQIDGGTVRLVRGGQSLDSFDLLLSSQTIAFSGPSSLVIGATVALSATASSGLAVTFSSLTPSICSISGSVVTGLGTGTCTVAADQAGDSSTNAAPQITQNVSVAPHSYSKIANNGSVLPDSAVLGSGAGDWACTRDNTTGLIWEVKTTDDGLRDWSKGYTNYDDPTQAQRLNGSQPINPTQAEIDAASNSIGLVNAVNTNASALCGYRDWKMPSVDELSAIVDRAHVPMINLTFFPNTSSSVAFGSGSPHAIYSYEVWDVGFYFGVAFTGGRYDSASVRLVRGGQSLGSFGLSVSATGTGSGTVTSSAAGINCASTAGNTSGTCSAPLAADSTVTLTAAPANGSTFAGWTGACFGSNPTCSVIMAARKSVTANFGTLLSQTIIFGTAPSIRVGGTGTVSATGGASGQPVTFSSLTPSTCSVSGSRVTAIAAGTCTVAANQSGNGTYNAALQATQNIAIGKIGQTITFGSAPSFNSGGSGTLSASARSGLPVTFSSLTLTICSVSDSTVNGLAPGTCTVVANQAGNADYSAAAQVTQSFTVGKKASQTITFGPAPTLPVGGTATLTATASSGLEVSFSSLTRSNCSVSGSTVTGLAAGSCSVAANQAGDASYSAAPQATQSFVLGKLSQTITFGAAPTLTIGGTGTLDATASSGLPLTFTSLTAAVCSVSDTTVTGVAAGTCIVAANQAGDASTYPAPRATQSLVLKKASQTIAFGTAPTLAVGGTATLDATATSGLAVAFSSLSTSICTVSGNTVSGVAVGSCKVAANQAGNASFNAAAQATQSFDLGKGSQTIAFGVAPTVATGGTGSLSASASSGLPVSFSSLTLSTCRVTGRTVTGVAAGSCTIAANQAGNANYGAAAQQTQIFSIGTTAGRYSKIANNGSTLSDSAVLGSGPGDWACTRDNQTGLTWEIKTTDGGLRDTSKLFRNYDDVGVAQKGVGQFPTQADILAASNSIGFAKAVNASALCSYDQWRLPSSDELGSLIDSYYSPMINPSHFPNTLANSYMWTSTAHSTDPAKGWVLYFNDGVSYLGERKNSYYVRLVRTSQALATHELAIATSGTGSGTVASDVSGINCSASAGAASGTCVAAFSRGSTVTLIATAASGSTFSGWSGDCTGTEACTVTLNGPRKLTASFRQRPFVATTNSVITPTSATISTRIAFNPGDVGKQGFVFVTAWMPFSGLGSLALSNARSGDPSVTSTLDAPYAGERHAELQVAQTSLSKTESSSYVLVQLTASGWQLVVNGQLIPYASGVLGDLLAAQTLLTNANPSALQGTQFCLGYGTSAEEMIASGRMLPVASISDPNPTGSTSTGSCNVAASTPASTYTGLWWNQNESGWGVSVTQRDSTAVVAWYTYDSGAQPSWFIISSCMMAGAGCTGDLYSVTGGTRLGTPWNGSGKTVSKVGSGTFAFSDNNTGTLNYTVNGAGGSKALTRLVYAEGSSKPAIDYSSLWWNESESGWGITITQQYGMIVAVIYTYDTVGKPTWYIASSCPIMETRCFGDLYQVTGGKAPVVPWSGANPAVKKVGSVNFEFNDSNVGTIKYTINGVAGTKAITRLLF